MDIDADVTDRKWDTQGSVSLKGVAILDHITPGKVGSQKQNNGRGSCGCMYLMMKHACGDSVFSTCVPYLSSSLLENQPLTIWDGISCPAGNSPVFLCEMV